MTNIQDGIYNAVPVTAAVYERNEKLQLEVHFNLVDERGTPFTQTGTNGREYPIEKRKYYVLVTADGAVNTKTIDYIKEWASGWDGSDPYWFTDAANLAHIGMVEVDLRSKPGFSDPTKVYQNIEWVNRLGHNASRAGAKKEVASDDRAAIMAKYGAKFKAAAGASVRLVAAAAAPARVAPQASHAAPSATAYEAGMKGQAAVWDEYSNAATAKGIKQADIESGWFAAIDAVTGDGKEGSGKDQMDITGEEWGRIADRLAL